MADSYPPVVAVSLGVGLGTSVAVNVAVGGVVAVGEAVAVGVGVSVGRGVNVDVGEGGTNPVGVIVDVRVIVGCTDGDGVVSVRVGVELGEPVGVGVAPLGALRMKIRPAQ